MARRCLVAERHTLVSRLLAARIGPDALVDRMVVAAVSGGDARLQATPKACEIAVDFPFLCESSVKLSGLVAPPTTPVLRAN